jgi:hypothetical protein
MDSSVGWKQWKKKVYSNCIYLLQWHIKTKTNTMNIVLCTNLSTDSLTSTSQILSAWSHIFQDLSFSKILPLWHVQYTKKIMYAKQKVSSQTHTHTQLNNEIHKRMGQTNTTAAGRNNTLSGQISWDRLITDCWQNVYSVATITLITAVYFDTGVPSEYT